MESQQTPEPTLDILALLDQEDVAMQEKVPGVMEDILSQMENLSEEIPEDSETEDKPRESLLTRFRRVSAPKIQFLFYYLGISTVVFVVLLATTNWSSYFTVLSSYLNPEALMNSKNDIVSVLDRSRVTVYANDTIDSSATAEEQTSLKKKLEESNMTVREDRFSPKRLIS